MAKRQEEIVKGSHERSKRLGVDINQVVSRKILSEAQLRERLKENHSLLEVAKPILKNLYDFLEDTGFIAVLTDGKGCILSLFGDKEVVKAAQSIKMSPGVYMDEASIGTNAMGTALSEDSPIQITAKEHFITAYHQWTCSAAPIHDTEGNILGVINLTGSSELVHPHTLGLVVAAVKSVENQLQSDTVEAELSETSLALSSIVDNLSYGLISCDINGHVQKINKIGVTMLGYPASALDTFDNITTLLPGWPSILDVLTSGDKILDEEIEFNTTSGKEKFVVNALPIRNPQDEGLTGVIITYREFKRVYSVISKFSGMKARYTFEEMIFNSDTMRRVVDYAKAIANSPSTVLILGESGTGKEVLAQAIHSASTRSKASFVAVNCGAIPSTLMESELFGYEDGAFTGARRGGKPGKFELANDGTIFLDEIGEMPIDMQVKLLRAIQEGKITRVGGEKEIPVDVRIIAATNRNLKNEVDEGRFRMDLYYRLSVIPITLPPLKDRKEDIPLLIKYFLNTKALKLKKSVPEVSNELYQKLLRHPWPGNIRELENFIEKLVNFDGNAEVADLAGTFSPRLSESTLGPQAPTAKPIRSLEQMEKEAIANALTALKGNISHIAKALGVSRNTLYLKMKKYELGE
ncbi:Transcriptional regulator of acetoin/glycerol metabolism [Williamwhitmania taraxaci]|uniref:Transcriptional regulator of acetoin/glycerol metabolism n=2 Tax=Williamwhitmania taraxaci TaxID=1640674 RepID=A0A1G6GG87_9BACT|nr:Transcriptional regulator of acetoin/glycerol metabolism [Williamwhitmania taraxaci]